jgi:hypothetical protein
MKKILVTIIGFSFFANAFGQEAFDKKMQFGIVYGFGLNMNKTSTLLERKGVGLDNIVGLNVNYNLNQTLTLTSGLEFDFESFKYTPKDTVLYYYTDNNIVKKSELDTVNTGKSHNLFSLQERQYKVNYLTIPVFLTLKTKPFGNMQYFGKFGTRISLKVGGRINDEGYNFVGDSLTGGYSKEMTSNTNMVLEDDVRAIKINAGIGGGAMWNFSGTTMLVAEMGYFFGLTQMHMDERLTGDDKKRSFTLLDLGNDNTFADKKYAMPAAKQGQFLIKLTLFF